MMLRLSRPLALTVLAVSAATLLAVAAVRLNLERSCIVDDTPYLGLCPQDVAGSPSHLTRLRSRIASNPGDTPAHVQLALNDPSPARAQLMAMATQLSPSDPGLQLAHAAAALDQQDWRKAAGLLVALSEHRSHPQATLVLARLIGAGHAQLLLPYLTPGSQWFARVLAQMPQVQAPFSSALPLVVQALAADVLDPRTVPLYIRQLKADAAWTDAYALWAALHKQRIPILYNGGFDQQLQTDGFDWEPAVEMPGRAGVMFDRPNRDKRGPVLALRFTGRRLLTPMLRQYLYLGAGRYRIQGEYQTQGLRMEQGLAWAVRCTARTALAGRSPPLRDTSGAWQRFELEVDVPAGCGQVASLQLETYAPFEADAGARGKVAFNGLSLEKHPETDINAALRR